MLAMNVVLLLLISILLHQTKADKTTYYKTLQIEKNASLEEIKKAYRSLALKHHPDRNKGNEEESSEQFHAVGEAYEVLSNEDSRLEYDRSLLYGNQYDPGSRENRERQPRWHTTTDPMEQFNNLFRNDPFFRKGFEEMDGLFHSLFEDGGAGHTNDEVRQTNKNQGEKGIFGTIMDHLGVKVTTSSSTSSSSSRHGSTHSTSRTYGSSGNSRSSYTSRSTRTIIQNGQRVTIQSLEKDGNQIEEKYVNHKLIERRINGVLELDGADVLLSHEF